MDLKNYIFSPGEKPLDHMVTNGGFTGIFRTIACIGDSLSSGELESFELGHKGYHDYFEYSWGQFIARDAGCKVYNFSRGGMSTRAYMEGFAEEKGFFDIELRAQAYIMALGVNDTTFILSKELELGTIEDINPKNYTQNKPTFAGYYGAIISKYKEIQPHAKFFLMTMPRDGADAERNAIYDQMSELIRAIAKLFSNCFVLDFRKYAPDYDETFKKKFFLGGHLNVQGYRLTALMVESYIDYLIRAYPEEFKQCGYIGKPFYNGENL